MGKKVIIAEKPSVAREFAKVLKINGTNNNGYIESNEYIVTWCVGHLVTMSYPEKYDEKMRYWNLNTLPFIPKEYKYEVIDSVSTQFKIVSNILNREDVDAIYVCTDSGREGEYIYRLVDNMAGNPDKEKRRVWIDSQTEEAILNGIKEAKLLKEYNSLSDAAFLRAKEDYLIGINFSRLLSLIYAKDLAKKLNEDRVVISIGRVMTCVLGMIVKREREIRDFKKVNFYKIQGTFGVEGQSFLGEWKSTEKSKVFESPKLYSENGFKKKEDALKFIDYLNKCESEPVIESVSKKSQKEKPPLLFNLAELQNECTRRFKISPDETLQIVQTLYEKKLVTYPRTDARVLSSSVAKVISKNLNGLIKSKLDESVKVYLNKMVKEKYSTKLEKTKYVDDSKITDHYAIIPTGQGFENYDKLEKLQLEVYHLIVKRFIAIFYPPAEYSKISISINLNNEMFFANGKVCTKQGYLEVAKSDKNQNNLNDDSKKEEDSTEKMNNLEILAKLKKGQKLQMLELNLKEGETSPPSRYSSGSMILAMENAGKLIEDEELREQIKGSGIGTSATRAEIIKKLEKIAYIESNKKTQILTPTRKGESIYDIVLKTMPDMLNPELTASWEKGLTLVAESKIPADEFMSKLESYIKNKIVKFKKARNEYLYGI
ncbi:MAG: DNA topoisomerase [Clostridia bacterium]|nr:DNA topoisomerase [Clostridia bacterium]